MSNQDNVAAAAANLSVWEKVKLLQDWYPLFVYAQAFLAAGDAHAKTVVVADCLEWLASKTKGTQIDDELVQHLTAVLKSPQGEALVRWVVGKVEKA